MDAVFRIGRFLDVAAFQHLDDIQAELLCKFIITRIVCRYCHDRTGSIACQHIVRDPDRDLSAVHRIDGIRPGKDTGLFFVELRALQIGFGLTALAVSHDCLSLLRCRDLLHERMFRRHDTVGCAKQRITACGKYRKFFIGILDLEDDIGSL